METVHRIGVFCFCHSSLSLFFGGIDKKFMEEIQLPSICSVELDDAYILLLSCALREKS